MKALILAGGLGLRLSKEVNPVPKVMASVGGKPFLEHMVRLLSEKGISSVVIAVGNKAKYVTKHFGNGNKFGVPIKYCYEDKPLGTGGAVHNACSCFDNEDVFLVFNGDTYYDFNLQDFVAFHKGCDGVASMAVLPLAYGDTTGVKYSKNTGKISSLKEEEPGTKRGNMKNGGVYIFSHGIFDYFPKVLKNISIEEEFFPYLVKKRELYAWEGKGIYYEIGTPERYNRAVKELPKKLAQSL